MRRIFVILFALLTVAGLSAQVKKYQLEVGNFNELIVADDINVIYKYSPDSAGWARFVCEPAMARALTFVNNKEKLRVELTRDEQYEGEIPTVTVYSDGLKKVTNQGLKHVDVAVLTPCKEIKAKVIGNGSMSLAGVHCTQLECSVETGKGTITATGSASQGKYTVVASGTIDARDVDVNHATCWMAGTGLIVCDPRETMSVYGVGSGRVAYQGDPKIKKRALWVKLLSLAAGDSLDLPAEE